MSRRSQDKKHGRPKASEIVKPAITNNEVRDLIGKGWSRHQICKRYFIGRARVKGVMEEMQSETQECNREVVPA